MPYEIEFVTVKNSTLATIAEANEAYYHFMNAVAYLSPYVSTENDTSKKVQQFGKMLFHYRDISIYLIENSEIPSSLKEMMQEIMRSTR